MIGGFGTQSTTGAPALGARGALAGLRGALAGLRGALAGLRGALAGLRGALGALGALRAAQWRHFAVLPAASAYPALRETTVAALPRLAAAVGTAALCLAYAYGLNAIADRHGDRSRSKNPLAGSAHVSRAAWIVVATSGAVALLGGVGLGPAAALSTAASLAAGTVYSVGPRWKVVPFLSTATNAAIFTPLLFLGAGGPWPPGLATLAVTFVALLTQNQLVHEVVDREEDAASGAHTTAAVLGPRRAMVAASGIGLAGAAVLLIVSSRDAAAIAAVVGLVAASWLVGSSGASRALAARRAQRRLSVGLGALVVLLCAVTEGAA